MRKVRRYSGTVKDAASLAKTIFKQLTGADVIALYGPLGSGKTTFVKHLAKLLGFNGTVTSPTFTLLQTYRGKSTQGAPLHIHHLDLYRLENSQEVFLSGIVEPWGEENSVSLIEWADRAEDLLPNNVIRVTFKSL